MTRPAHTVRRGFLLLEMVLALAVFGIAATGFAVALHRMAALAALAQSELRITRILDSALHETLSLPSLVEGVTHAKVAETGIVLDTQIALLDTMENQDGQMLQGMYRITVSAKWLENTTRHERSVETWRYANMYLP